MNREKENDEKVSKRIELSNNLTLIIGSHLGEFFCFLYDGRYEKTLLCQRRYRQSTSSLWSDS
jgi:hypothetical protein